MICLKQVPKLLNAGEAGDRRIRPSFEFLTNKIGGLYSRQLLDESKVLCRDVVLDTRRHDHNPEVSVAAL